MSRPRRFLVVAAAALALGLTLTACGGSGSSHAIPSFHPGTGRFRIVSHPSAGAPAPQVIDYGGHRLQADLSEVDGSGKSARAVIVFVLQDTNARVPVRSYRTGDDVQVGPVRVHIDGVYGSGDQHIAVDVTLS